MIWQQKMNGDVVSKSEKYLITPIGRNAKTGKAKKWILKETDRLVIGGWSNVSEHRSRREAMFEAHLRAVTTPNSEATS